MRTVGPIADVFAAGLPEGVNPADESLQALLTSMARQQLTGQYDAAEGHPQAILVDHVHWVITNDPAEIAQFEPVHRCVRCLAGMDQIQAFAAEHPDRYVALANIEYTEVWAD